MTRTEVLQMLYARGDGPYTSEERQAIYDEMEHKIMANGETLCLSDFGHKVSTLISELERISTDAVTETLTR